MLVKAVPQCSRGEAESKRIRVLLDGVRLGLCHYMAPSQPACQRKPRESRAWVVISDDCSRPTFDKIIRFGTMLGGEWRQNSERQGKVNLVQELSSCTAKMQ